MSAQSHPVLPASAVEQRGAAGRGRHALRRKPVAAQALDAVGHVGTVVTLASLLVLAGAFGGLTDGSPANAPTVTATLDGPTGP